MEGIFGLTGVSSTFAASNYRRFVSKSCFIVAFKLAFGLGRGLGAVSAAAPNVLRTAPVTRLVWTLDIMFSIKTFLLLTKNFCANKLTWISPSSVSVQLNSSVSTGSSNGSEKGTRDKEGTSTTLDATTVSYVKVFFCLSANVELLSREKSTWSSSKNELSISIDVVDSSVGAVFSTCS